MRKIESLLRVAIAGAVRVVMGGVEAGRAGYRLHRSPPRISCGSMADPACRS